MSAVLLTLRIIGGAKFGLDGLEDAFWVYFKNAPVKTASVNSDQAIFLFNVMLQPNWAKKYAFLKMPGF